MKWVRIKLWNLTTVATAICAGVILIMMINQQVNTNKQLQELKRLADSQQKIIDQINRGVTDIKGTSQQNTDRIQCLISLHAVGSVPVPSSCQPGTPERQAQDVASAGPAGSPTVQSVSPTDKQGASSPPEPPSRSPGLIRSLFNATENLLKSLLP